MLGVGDSQGMMCLLMVVPVMVTDHVYFIYEFVLINADIIETLE